MTLSDTFSVALYTLVELTRRRLLLVLVAITAILTLSVGFAPFILPGMGSADERTVFVLGAISRIDGLVIALCGLGIGMTVINHDLDSGVIVGLLAKPITRFSYAAGKLGSAVSALVLIDVTFTLGSVLIVGLDGGGHSSDMFWFFATSTANAVLLMVLVMILTVYLNNVVAAAIVLAFSLAQGQIATLYAMVQSNVIVDRLLRAVVDVAYWLMPHQLLSNLERAVVIAQYNVNCSTGCPGMKPTPAQYLANQLNQMPGASGAGDVVYWLAYLAVVCTILYIALRRKQV